MDEIWFKYLAISLATIITYIPSIFWCQKYLFDDANAIQHNPDVLRSNGSLLELFSHDFWGTRLTDSGSHKSYRPLTVLTYRVIYHASDRPMLLFRIMNVGLHAINTLLVSKIGRTLGLREWALSGIIFGLHPVHSEPVLGLVGAADLLYSLLTLTSLLLVLCAPQGTAYGLSLLLSLPAVLYKEQGIMLLPMVFTLDAFFHRSSSYKSLVIKGTLIAFASSSILALRLLIMDFRAPSFQEGDNPASFLSSFPLRILNYHYLYSINLFIFLVPIWQCFDWSMGCIPRILKPMEDLRTLLVILFWALGLFVLVKGLHRRRRRVLVLLLGILPFLPSSNIFFRVGFVIAERNLYLSLMGWAFLIGEGFLIIKYCYKRWQINHQLLMIFTLCVFSCACLKRSAEWSSEVGLYTSGLRVCPLNAKIYYNIAKRESEKSVPDMKSVIKYYEASLALWPNYEHAMNNLGNAYRSIKAYDRARDLFERALRLSPTFASCWMNLGILYTAMGSYESAQKSYFEAIKCRKDYADAHYNLGILYIKMRRSKEARASFGESIRLRPRRNLKAWINLVILEDEEKDLRAAEEVCLRALDLFGDSADLTFHLANTYGKMGRIALAEEEYLRAMSLSRKENPLFNLNLGILYHRDKQFKAAIGQYKKVISLDPSNQNARKYLAQLEKK